MANKSLRGVIGPPLVVPANRTLFDQARATQSGVSGGLDKEAERRRLVHKLKNTRSFRAAQPEHHHQEPGNIADNVIDDNRSVGSSFRRPLKAFWRGSAGEQRRASISSTPGTPASAVGEEVAAGLASSLAAAFVPRRRFARNVQSFRWKKAKSTSRSASDANMVMDLSDVQSMASEPEHVGSKKVSFLGRSKSIAAGFLETNSVGGSGRSKSPFTRRQFSKFNGLLSLGLGDKKDNSQASQSRIDTHYMSGEVADDEDITVSSGLDPSNRSDDGEDEEEAVVVYFQETIPAVPPPRLTPVRSGISLNDSVLVSMVQGSLGATTTTSFSSTSSSQYVDESLVPPYACVATVVEPSQNYIAEPNQDEEVDEDEDLDVEVAQATASVAPSVQQTPKVNPPVIGDKFAEEYKYDRWSPISFEVPQKEPPKPPTRRVEEVKEEPEYTSKLDDLEESSDDSSVYSILSGLWTAWEAENTARKNAYVDCIAPAGTSHLSNQAPNRCCLKKSLPSSTSGRRPNAVRFGFVQVREYERTLGDNPSCTVGPPLSLGWNYVLVQEIPIEIHNSRPRRSKRQFHVSPTRREEILLDEWGCSSESLLRARRDAIYAQYCRSKSAFADDRLKEAAYLRKASRTPQKPQPDHDEGSLSPPQAPSRRSTAQMMYSPWSAPTGDGSCTPPTPVRRFPSSPIATAVSVANGSLASPHSPTKRSFSREIYTPLPFATSTVAASISSPTRRSTSREIYAPLSPSRGHQPWQQAQQGPNSPTKRCFTRELYTPPPYPPLAMEYDLEMVEVSASASMGISPSLPRRASLPSTGARGLLPPFSAPQLVPDLDMTD